MANSVELTLPIEVPLKEGETFDDLSEIEQAIDTVVIYRRDDAYTLTEIGSAPLGTSTFSDPAGVINDEYHITFRDSVSGVESLPSQLYRVLNPFKQREEDGVVVVVLELETSSVVPTVDFVAIYRRKPTESVATRIALVPIGTQFYQDPDGEPGDVYHSTFVDTTNSAESQPSAYVIANANTGLVVVSGRFEDPSGDPMLADTEEFRDVEVLLVIPDEKSQRTPTAQGQVFGPQKKKALLDENGFWSLPLVPNDLILPNNTFYIFSVGDQRFYKRVDSSNGPVQNLALLADVLPRFSQH